MFRKLIKNKRALAVLGAVSVLAVAGIAVAFWTASGSGTGTGKAATSDGTLTLHGSISNELTPGSTSPVTFSADNSGTGAKTVGSVSAVVTTDKAGCTASDFEIVPTEENQSIAGGASSVPLANNGSITMIDSLENQDACKGATISLALTS